MDPLSALRATYYIVLFGIELDQVPLEVKNSLELVRTCHTDLQYLIEIRNELLPLLQRRPKVLERVNSIVETTHKGLVEVCEIVEKSRPRLNNGRTPFRSRLSWILLDSAQFKAQRPVISRHHASVLAELNFLRQIALLTPSPKSVNKGDDDGTKKSTMLFDNVALLEDLIGKANVSGSAISPPAYPNDIKPPEQSQPHDSTASRTLFAVPSRPSTVFSTPSPSSIPRDCPKLPTDFLFPSLSTINIPEHLLDQTRDAPSESEYEKTGGEVLDSSDGDGMSLLFGDYANMTPILSSTPSVSSVSTTMSPWPPGADHLYRPASVVSSLSSLRGTPEFPNSETTLGDRSTSARSLEDRAHEHQSEELHRRNMDSPSVPGMVSHAISSRSISTTSSNPTPAPSLVRQFRAWSSPSFSLLGQHRRKASYQSSTPNTSPSDTTEDSKVTSPSFIPPDAQFGQHVVSNGRFRAYSRGIRNDAATRRPTSPSRLRRLDEQAVITDFAYEERSLRSQAHKPCDNRERPPHPLSQAISEYSLRGGQIPQTRDDIVPQQEPGQARVFEMMGSIPDLHQLANYQRPINQRQFVEDTSPMASKEKQGSTSFPSDPGVFELP
ncbi:hypothetical protein BDP81DRAFT_39682 [Colletotrichum phormii]|uniref:Uncharacterized protein n=1 Tax=Colletotrichum phormii TaxID=359342 RepID=A0AAI9ZRC6_9PEZI|nr:uncharacterized protein BDP81DRAFT_39682 [Colletotrichum phormii]KAK1635583.1 hypothetical protein BDP81DRAFT_39682 [Colletotrichum phormii]